MKKKDEMINKSGESLQAITDSLDYYQEEKCAVHIVLRNRRFYNGEIIEIRDNIIILNDKKIGKVPISIKEVYLVESFHDPKNGGNKNG